MSKFKFTVVDLENRVRTGALMARDLAAAQQMIASKGFRVVELVQVDEPPPAAAPPAPPLSAGEQALSSRPIPARLPIPSSPPEGWTKWASGPSSGLPQEQGKEAGRSNVPLPLGGIEGSRAGPSRTSGEIERARSTVSLPIAGTGTAGPSPMGPTPADREGPHTREAAGGRTDAESGLEQVSTPGPAPRGPTEWGPVFVPHAAEEKPLSSESDLAPPELPPLPRVSPALTRRIRLSSISEAGPAPKPLPPLLYPPPDTEGLGPDGTGPGLGSELIEQERDFHEAEPPLPSLPPLPKASSSIRRERPRRMDFAGSQSPEETAAASRRSDPAELLRLERLLEQELAELSAGSHGALPEGEPSLTEPEPVSEVISPSAAQPAQEVEVPGSPRGEPGNPATDNLRSALLSVPDEASKTTKPAPVGASTRSIDLRTIDFSIAAPAKPEPKAASTPAPVASRDLLQKEVEALTSKLEFRSPTGSPKPVPSVSGKKAYRAEPAAEVSYRPGLAEKGSEFAMKTLLSFLFIAGIGMLGVFWLIWSWFTPPSLAKHSATANYGPLQFHCIGNVLLPTAADYSDVSVSIEFPQVPFRKAYSWSTLQHYTASSYELPVDLKFVKLPGFFVIHALKPGFKEGVSSREQVPANGEMVRVADIFVRRESAP
jgi:hypothetical protein